MPPARALIALAAGALLALGPAAAATPAAVTGAECEKVFRPQVGQAGKDVIWVPTPDELVEKMLSTARVSAQDFVVDLGAGDGKIAIAAARRFGATALGIEYNPDMVRLAQCHVQAAGVADKVTMIQGDIFKEDFSRATVVTMYLLPDLNLCVRHRLLAMKPGTRVTSHAFTMGEWEPDQQFGAEHRSAYLWIVPARVAGTWRLRNGERSLDLTLQQSYQRIGGEVAMGDRRYPLLGASLDGERLRFSFVDAAGDTHQFSGTVSGRTMEGELRGTGVQDLTGTLRAPAGPARWAAMAPNCERFYR
jgi:SAM-dependent methyltransferase